MEIGASLASLELTSPDPSALADFYAATFRLQASRGLEMTRCHAAARELLIHAGEAGGLRRAAFRFHDDAAHDEYRIALRTRGVEMMDIAEGRFTVTDPEGRLVTFLARVDPVDPVGTTAPFNARLQHFGVRTPRPAPLLDFYAEKLGFIVSDCVFDAKGDLTAAFLRTDAEHHSMAIFRAPAVRFDHFSCETSDWTDLRDWADHMAAVGVDLAWGIGRHGPGNDTFLMVRDPDGNMGEVSCDLEVCSPGRPAGTWPHRPQTLNQWGVALMRS